jgi:high-affinity K+ transport system ATPase subunit B
VPNHEVRSRSFFANILVILFIIIVFANLASTLLECGIGPCSDDPVKYEGWIWLRTHFGF